MEVSWNRGTPKSSILIGFSIVNHPEIGYPHDLGKLHTCWARACLDRPRWLHVFSQRYSPKWISIWMNTCEHRKTDFHTTASVCLYYMYIYIWYRCISLFWILPFVSSKHLRLTRPSGRVFFSQEVGREDDLRDILRRAPKGRDSIRWSWSSLNTQRIVP